MINRVRIMPYTKPKITVMETSKEKILTFDGAIFSIINKGSVYTGLYWDYFTPLPLLYKRSRVLMIGLGGGTIPYQLKKLYDGRVDIDIVEISRVMVRKAKTFNPNLEKIANVIVGDGDKYLDGCISKYDILILDAYGTGFRIPEKFLSESFITKANKALKPNGVFGINYIFTFRQLLKFHSYMKLLERNFSVYKISEGMYFLSNLLIFCLKGTDVQSMRKTIRSGLKPDPAARHIMDRF